MGVSGVSGVLAFFMTCMRFNNTFEGVVWFQGKKVILFSREVLKILSTPDTPDSRLKTRAFSRVRG